MRTIPGRFIVLAILIATALVVSIAAVMLFGHPRGKVAPPPSIAILPLAGDDGHLAAQIAANLSRIPNFYVSSSSAVTEVSGKSMDSRKIGEALNVRTLLKGEVDGGRVTVRLVNAADDFQYWSKTYDAATASVEIPVDIARTLGLKLN